MLLEGLDAVEIPLSTCKGIIDFRIDANTYKKEYLASDKLLRKMKTQSVGEISISIQNFGAYSLCNFINFQSEGIPFLMTKNVRDNFIDWNIEKFVDQKSHDMLWKSHCCRGQVLVTMAGEYLGRVAVYNSDGVASSNQAIAKVSLKKGQNPYTVSTFLNSKFGQHQIQRFKTITGQPNINMSLIESLRVPEFSAKFCQSIEKLMLKVDDVSASSFDTYLQAEILLLDKLGMVVFLECHSRAGGNPDNQTIFPQGGEQNHTALSLKPLDSHLRGNGGVVINIKSFKESFVATGRLDAEYYQPKYEDYQSHVLAYPNGWQPLLEACNLKDSNFTPDDNIVYKYIELADIDKSGSISGCTEAQGVELPSRARRIVATGDVLISSIEGSLPSCAIVSDKMNEALCSTGFYVINSRNINAETLLVLFKSPLLQNLLKQRCSGTILTAISKTEFQSIPVPIIEREAQTKIAALVQESFTLKAESERLLGVAKRAVEIAIEQDEASALSWISSQASNLGVSHE